VSDAFSRIKWKYKTITSLFALLMCYLSSAAVVCAVQAAKEGGNTYRVMLFSIILTYGGVAKSSYDCATCNMFPAWTASSLLAFDPWHMLTSCASYMLLSPTYITVLNM
jgi:chitin synthase